MCRCSSMCRIDTVDVLFDLSAPFDMSMFFDSSITFDSPTPIDTPIHTSMHRCPSMCRHLSMHRYPSTHRYPIRRSPFVSAPLIRRRLFEARSMPLRPPQRRTSPSARSASRAFRRGSFQKRATRPIRNQPSGTPSTFADPSVTCAYF